MYTLFIPYLYPIYTLCIPYLYPIYKDVAGATLLALGGAAPDIFTQVHPTPSP